MKLCTSLLFATVALAEIETFSASGSLTTPVTSSTNTLKTETKITVLSVGSTQEVVFKEVLASGDYLESFVCWQRLSIEWVCSRTALEVFDGTKFTIKNWAYTKTSAPLVTDFVANESFSIISGFS